MAVAEAFEGCLVGLAVGDALGMPVEGMPPWEIKKRFGQIKGFMPAPQRGLEAGQFTDDTQMMLIHAESIVTQGNVDPQDLARRFVRWLSSGEPRGIGRSTFRAIRRLMQGASWQESGETGTFAAGNGVAMRIAPIGLLNAWTPQRLREDVEKAGIITHRHPESLKGGLAVAYAVSRLVFHPTLDSFIEDVCKFIGPCLVESNLRRAARLLGDNIPTEEALRILGTTGYVVHTVAAAFFCFLKSPDDFAASTISAVMGGYDTDTTAAVAGALSGAYNGIKAIPDRWVQEVEMSDHIRSLARSICRLAEARARRR